MSTATPNYVGESTFIFRQCPVHGCSEMLEANSHSGQVRALHGHLKAHNWAEKRRFL